jgi:REP element-mobilizing transposase RayT
MATRPRNVVPDATYIVTRRCTQRQLLLRPDEVACAIFIYVLAVAASRFGIQVHAFCVMSNHFHIVLTDPYGLLPAFSQYFDSLVARAMNVFLGRRENFWEPGSYSAVRLVTPQDIIDKTAYVLANPVAAGLVPHGKDWPGLWSGTDAVDGEAIEAVRPVILFKKKGSMPATAQLRLTRPPGFDTTADFVAPVAQALAAAEDEAAASLRKAAKRFLGVAKVLAQDPFARPATKEPFGKLNPRIACKDKWRRIQALQRLGTFVSEYRAALAQWRAGVRDVLFPAGTWLMRRQHGVCCAEFG